MYAFPLSLQFTFPFRISQFEWTLLASDPRPSHTKSSPSARRIHGRHARSNICAIIIAQRSLRTSQTCSRAKFRHNTSAPRSDSRRATLASISITNASSLLCHHCKGINKRDVDSSSEHGAVVNVVDESADKLSHCGASQTTGGATECAPWHCSRCRPKDSAAGPSSRTYRRRHVEPRRCVQTAAEEPIISICRRSRASGSPIKHPRPSVTSPHSSPRSDLELVDR